MEFIHIYPNPTNGTTTLILKEPIEKGHIEIMNNIGQTIYRIDLVNQNRVQLDLSTYDNGLYIVQVYNENRLISNQKIIRN